RWTSLFEIDGDAGQTIWTGIHTVLARGNGDTTAIVHFQSDPRARLMLIPPGQSTVDVSSGQLWSGINSLQVNVPQTVTPFADLFCGGHIQQHDGRVLYVSGTAKETNGHRQCRIFDPRSYFNPSTWGWSATDSLRLPRWYPTLTELGDGRIVSHSGIQYYNAMRFGGTVTGGGETDSLIPLALSQSPYWDDRHPTDPDVGAGNTWPTALSDAAADFSRSIQMPSADARGVIAIFGGRSGSTPKQELWIAWREGYHDREHWKWELARANTNSPAAEQVPPLARSEHTLVADGSVNGDTLVAIVFGGRGAGGAALNDLWRVRFYRTNLGGGHPFRFDAVPLTSSGASPGYRFGHAAVFDPGPLNSQGIAQGPRMLVFGGKNEVGALADNKTYSLNLSTWVWSIVNDGTTAPSARYRARAAFVKPLFGEYNWQNLTARMFVSGGENADGSVRHGDLWKLVRCSAAASGCNTYTWANWSPSGGTPLPARSGHVFFYDPEWRRLVLSGGRLAGGAIADDAWFLPVDFSDGCGAGSSANCAEYYWRQASQLGTLPPATDGAVGVYFALQVAAREPEIFDPNEPTGQRWTTLDAPHYTLDTYPFMFLLPSGNLFQSGRDSRSITNEGVVSNTFPSYVLNPATGAWGQPIASGMTGASSVMYRPGKVLKSGAPGVGGATDPTRVIDLSTSETGSAWSSPLGGTQLAKRVEPNLVLLPSGDVLALGGRLEHHDDSPAEPRPQLFGPVSQTWSEVLPPDPSSRGYHSTAMLLPDARVMTLGGNLGSDSQLDKAAIYEPPYLFEGDTYALRPVISVAPETLLHGNCYTLTVGSAPSGIAEACLIRPGAVTHAFNMGQVYVPLA
ncbi:MAG: DUF1929 domain-containing protein, partial [Candidatus Eisenbacteria bacterium]|nr:DUF1929 domain-containing protein [Candidatus Eisenbacteria bacterium]